MLLNQKWQVGFDGRQEVRLLGLPGGFSKDVVRQNRQLMLVSSRGRSVVEIGFIQVLRPYCISKQEDRLQRFG